MTETIAQTAARFGLLPERLEAMLEEEVDATVEDAAARASTLARRRLRVRTGEILRGIRARTDRNPGLILGEGVPFVSIQEAGGIIRARGLRLAIPMTGTTAASPREYPGKLRFVPSAKGGTLVDERGVGRFVLRDRVTIKGTHFGQDGFDAAVAQMRVRIPQRVVQMMESDRG